MATRAKFARIAHYSRKFGEESHIFSKMAFGECRGVWGVSHISEKHHFCKCVYLPKVQKFWRVVALAKFALELPMLNFVSFFPAMSSSARCLPQVRTQPTIFWKQFASDSPTTTIRFAIKWTTRLMKRTVQLMKEQTVQLSKGKTIQLTIMTIQRTTQKTVQLTRGKTIQLPKGRTIQLTKRTIQIAVKIMILQFAKRRFPNVRRWSGTRRWSCPAWWRSPQGSGAGQSPTSFPTSGSLGVDNVRLRKKLFLM